MKNNLILEMSNVSDYTTGIKNVVIWIGVNPKYHGYRIKISNIPNKFDNNNCFTLTIPDLNIIGEVNKSFITQKKLEEIKIFININIDVIISYSKYEISTKKC